jgi:hypothetical protein
MIGDFSGEVLGSNGDRWKKVCKRTVFRDIKFVFHCLCGIASKKSCITFGSNAPETLLVHSTLIDVFGKLDLGIP